MDSREQFYQIIFDHYLKISNGKIALDLLQELSNKVTDYYYEQYSRFGVQYPKSIKRYSTFQLKDLNHPQTCEIVIKYFKSKLSDGYKEYSTTLLSMTEDELATFEKQREDFYKMF